MAQDRFRASNSVSPWCPFDVAQGMLCARLLFSDSGFFSRQGAKTQSDGPRPVIPSESEGSKKDFSLRSK